MQIGEDGRRCVVFFGRPSPPDGTIKYGGTGFLFALAGDGISHGYVVTCRHVAKALEDGDFVIRLNEKDGGPAVDVPAGPIDWAYHDDESVDLAVAPLAVLGTHWDALYLASNLMIPPDPDPYGTFHCGDLISIVGLFRLRTGKQRNIPVVHSGNIAALADPDEKIALRDGTTGKIVEVEAYMVEAQTLDGLSGSPVFAHRAFSVPFWVKHPELKPEKHGTVLGHAHLLGVYQGSWDGEPGTILAADKNLSDTKVRVPVGMGLVVPASKMMDIINGTKLTKMREEAVKEWKANLQP